MALITMTKNVCRATLVTAIYTEKLSFITAICFQLNLESARIINFRTFSISLTILKCNNDGT